MSFKSIEETMIESNLLFEAVMGSSLEEREVDGLSIDENMIVTFLDEAKCPQQAVISLGAKGEIEVYVTGEDRLAIKELQGRDPANIAWSEWASSLESKNAKVSYVKIA